MTSTMKKVEGSNMITPQPPIYQSYGGGGISLRFYLRQVFYKQNLID